MLQFMHSLCFEALSHVQILTQSTKDTGHSVKCVHRKVPASAGLLKEKGYIMKKQFNSFNETSQSRRRGVCSVLYTHIQQKYL